MKSVKYTNTEKILLIISLAILLPSFVIGLISDIENTHYIYLILSVISASEIIFINIYRDYTSTIDKIDHSLITIGITKFISIIIACIILLMAAFATVMAYLILNVLYELLMMISIPFVYVVSVFAAFTALVLMNAIIIRFTNKKPKK